MCFTVYSVIWCFNVTVFLNKVVYISYAKAQKNRFQLQKQN